MSGRQKESTEARARVSNQEQGVQCIVSTYVAIGMFLTLQTCFSHTVVRVMLEYISGANTTTV